MEITLQLINNYILFVINKAKEILILNFVILIFFRFIIIKKEMKILKYIDENIYKLDKGFMN